MAKGIVEALIQSRFAVIAGKATQRLELQAVQREVAEIAVKVEDVVEMMISEVEDLGEADLLSRRSSLADLSRSRDDILTYSRPTRVLIDSLTGVRRKVEIFTELCHLLLRNYNDFKQQCEEMSQKVEALTDNFTALQQGEDEPKECRNCKRCLSKITEFSTEIVQLRAELAKTEALLIDSRQAKDQLTKELGNLSFRNKELERTQAKPDFAGCETLELQRELKQAETTVNVLENQLKTAQLEADNFRCSWQSVQSDLEMRETALRKAQNIIKKLNNESEGLAEQLNVSESLCESLKRDAHQNDKSYRDAQLQLQSLDVLRKTDSRLRDELQSLKSSIESIKSESADESQRLHEFITNLTHENETFQQQIVELETSIVALDSETKQHEDAAKLHEERISDLEHALAGKIREMEQMQHSFELRDEEHEAEIAHIKRTAENAIRAVQLSVQSELTEDTQRGSRSPIRGTSPVPGKRAASLRKTTTMGKLDQPPIDRPIDKESQAEKESFRGLFEETLHRETVLKSALMCIVTKAGAFVREKVVTLESAEACIRPEAERWMMRNEELETIVKDQSMRVTALVRVTKDLQQVVKLKNKQMDEQRKWAVAMIGTAEDSGGMLKEELAEVHTVLVDKVIQKGKDVLGLQVDVTMKTVGELRQKTAWLQEQNDHLEREVKEWGGRVDRLAGDLQTAEDLNAASQSDLSQRESDLTHIRQAIFSLQLPYLSSSLSSDPIPVPASSPSPLADDIIQSIQSIQQDLDLKSQDLSRLESKLRELITANRDLQLSFEEDKDALITDLRASHDAKSDLEKEIERIAQRLRDEEEEVRQQEGAANDLRMEIAGLTHERDVLSQENATIGERMRETITDLQRMETELQTVKSSNERLLKQMEDAQSEIANIAALKEQTVEQSSVIAQLRDQLAKSGQRGSEALLTEGSLLRRDPANTRVRSSDASLMAIDRLLTQKEEYIKELEMRLEQGKTDVLGVTAHSSVFDETQIGDSDPSSLRRAKSKISAYKRSFNKRLEEFESVLRLIEDSIVSLSAGHSLKVDWPPSSNPTLDSWVESLLQKICDCATVSNSARDREIRTILTVLSLLQSGEMISEDDRMAAAGVVSSLQKQPDIDLDFVSGQTVALIKRAAAGDMRKAARAGNFCGGEDATTVCMSAFHARGLIAAVESLDAVELCLVERKESILQVSEELDGLNKSLAEMPVRSSDLPGKIADMFSNFSIQFLQDLKRDLQLFAEALRDLKDVTRSNPPLNARLTTLWSYSQQTMTRRL